MNGDERRLISVTLRSGVAVSAMLLVAGIIAGLSAPPARLISPAALPTLLRDIASLRGDALIHGGLLLLMLTPLARVIVVTIGFVRRKESSFALISIGVLLLLIGTTIIGLWGVSQ